MALSTHYLEYGRHVARLRRRRRRLAYAPTSNTTSHDNHEKISAWVSFCFPYEYGALLGRQSSAIYILLAVMLCSIAEYFYDGRVKIQTASKNYQRYYTTIRLIRDLLSNTPNWYFRASEFRGYLFKGNA